MVEYPRTSEEELPELYEELDEMLARIETVLREHFPTRSAGDDIKVEFAEATAEDYLDAMWADSEVMVPFFQKITGLSDREFERQFGYRNIGSKMRGRKTDFRDEEPARAFGEVLEDLFPPELYRETLLFTFVTMWENDQRRHYRARYEDTVREFLTEQGFQNFKGNSEPGEPDLVIPDSRPYEVTGEVRVIQQKDKKKRFKEFGSEARIADEHFPDARFVVVANVGRYVNEVDREGLRQEIYDEAAGPIDAIFFQDELDEFVERLQEWGVSRQSTPS